MKNSRKFLLFILFILAAGCRKNQSVSLGGRLVREVVISDFPGFGKSNNIPNITFTDNAGMKMYADAFENAQQLPGIHDMAEADYLVQVIFQDNSSKDYLLWLNNNRGSIMKGGNSYLLYELQSNHAEALTESLKAPEQTAEQKSEQEIREIAYQWLQDADKKMVQKRDSAPVEEYTFTQDVIIGSSRGKVNLKGKDILMVLFETDNKGLGSIRVFVDKASYRVLGMVFEDKDLG